MAFSKTEKYLVPILLLSLLIVFLTIAFVSEGYYGGADNINHYLIARYSFQYPVLFFHGWGRPLYTILSSPFAQFGFMGIKVFNSLLAVLTLWIGYLTAKKLGYSPPILILVMIAFMPVYFIMIFTALTEILAGFVLILSVYLFFRGKYIASAVVISFIYFARSEAMIFYPIFLAAYLFKKQFKAIPFLFLGILLFTVVGGIYFRDFLWLIHKFPYPIHSEIYKEHGPLLHFFTKRDELFGLPLEILLVLGIILIFVQLFSKKKDVRNQPFFELVLLLAPFAGFFAMHSVLYWKALGGSIGYIRVITTVIPLASLICLKGYDLIDQQLKKIPFIRYIFMALISCWIISVALKTYVVPVQLSEDEKIIKNVAGWFKNSEYANHLVYYTDPNFAFYADLDPYDESRDVPIFHAANLHNVPDSAILVWDSHFGPNENAIPRDSVIHNPRYRILKVLTPFKEKITLGGYPYEVLVLLRLPAGQLFDNQEFLKNLKERDDLSWKEIKSFSNDFETPLQGMNSSKLTTETAHSGKSSYRMDEATEFSPGFLIQCSELKKNQGALKVRVSLFILTPTLIDTDQPSLIVSLDDKKTSYDYNFKSLRLMNLSVNQWTQVEYEVNLVPVHAGTDMLKVYIYNPGKNLFFIDDLKVDVLGNIVNLK
ncbi:MAG: hypothetical protein NTU98_09435 [Bacteroidetes bacterium]|nr:hypothetical protein [Bacteroidota bacterium]